MASFSPDPNAHKSGPGPDLRPWCHPHAYEAGLDFPNDPNNPYAEPLSLTVDKFMTKSGNASRRPPSRFRKPTLKISGPVPNPTRKDTAS
jgi:hypothetical protein